jgi:adenine-specific DNA-methyltransferase
MEWPVEQESQIRDHKQLPTQLLDRADALRREMAPHVAPKQKSALGQFMTPSPVARFMASLFPSATLQTCHLLDAGAGVGALSCAFLDRWASGEELDFQKVEVQAYEIDHTLRAHFETTLTRYAGRLPVTYKIFSGDFIWDAACKGLQGLRPFSHAILNPPYKKINSASAHRLILRRMGIETVNLYSAFVASSLSLMQPDGQLVAIIPRSFCNGPYYRPFREFLLTHAAFRHLHLFGSRNKAFKDDDVLQENIIILLERGGRQGNVTVSTSTDDSFTDLCTHEHPFDRIVFPDDPEHFIHVPTSLERNAIELSPGIRFSLDEIGVGVSTGPVVDFRLQEQIQQKPAKGTVPLLYPGHFIGHATQWPKDDMKRGNAIKLNADTRKWLYPTGFYTVTRRFSSKEERRRIVASVVNPASFPDASMLGFENHLNVFHEQRSGLPENLAHGLAAYLNTTAVDDQFRRFNGHTQVNATDLRLMKYPSRPALIALGKWARAQSELTQSMLEHQLTKLTK